MDVRSMLMERLASQAGLSAGTSEEELIARLSEGADPTMALLLKAMAERRSEAAPIDLLDAEEAEEPEPEPQQPSPEFLKAVNDLRRQAKQMFAELETLRARNDMLAAALGACYLCWGEDPGCELCGAAGRPGGAEPDRRLFGSLVLPAVRRLQRPAQTRPDPTRTAPPRRVPTTKEDPR